MQSMAERHTQTLFSYSWNIFVCHISNFFHLLGVRCLWWNCDKKIECDMINILFPLCRRLTLHLCIRALVAAITTLFTVYTEVQIKFTFLTRIKMLSVLVGPGCPNKGYVLGRHLRGRQNLKRARLYQGPQWGVRQLSWLDFEVEAAAVWWRKQWWYACLNATVAALLSIHK